MDNFVIQRGELKKRAKADTLLSELTLLAAAEDGIENWTDIEIITLKQHNRDRATALVWEFHDITDSMDIDSKIHSLMQKDEFNTAREFVEVTENKILVGVHSNIVNDDAIDKALIMLSELETFVPGTIKFFGDTILL